MSGYPCKKRQLVPKITVLDKQELKNVHRMRTEMDKEREDYYMKKLHEKKDMTKPNTTFKLSIRDIEIIEHALRAKAGRRGLAIAQTKHHHNRRNA